MNDSPQVQDIQNISKTTALALTNHAQTCQGTAESFKDETETSKKGRKENSLDTSLPMALRRSYIYQFYFHPQRFCTPHDIQFEILHAILSFSPLNKSYSILESFRHLAQTSWYVKIPRQKIFYPLELHHTTLQHGRTCGRLNCQMRACRAYRMRKEGRKLFLALRLDCEAWNVLAWVTGLVLRKGGDHVVGVTNLAMWSCFLGS